jgi:nucleotidyltransferase/DNA polymerase involved in DNA repair
VGSAQEIQTSHSISLFYAIGEFVEMDQKNLSKSSGKNFGKKIWRNIFAGFFPRHCVLQQVRLNVAVQSSKDRQMTKRKSGLPDDHVLDTGITSLCNVQSGTQMRAAALLIEKAMKKAQHFETVTLGIWQSGL